MGRTRTFDTAAAVRAARGVFWAQGYEQASLPALQEATGLGASSLYHAFGSKRGLFDAAVQSYLDEVARPRLRPLTAETVRPDAIVDYLAGLRDALARRGTLPGDHGCLLINAACAPVSEDAEVARTVGDYCAELRGALARGVAARLPELDEAARETLADACTGLVVAAFDLVRVDPAQSARSLDAAIALLDRAATR